MAFLIPLSFLTAFDNLGAVVSGARGYIFDAGTTNALQTYSNYILSSANSVPYITADSAGRFGPAYVEDGTLLRFQIRSADGGTTYIDCDNVLAPEQSTASQFVRTPVAHSANFNVDASMNGSTRMIDTTSGDISIGVNAATLGGGFWVTFVMVAGSNSVILSGGGNINGQSSYTMDTLYESVTILSTASEWLIVDATSREEFGEIDLATYTDSFTLQLSDKGKLLVCDKSTAMTVTVPPHSSVPFPIGTRCEGVQWNTGEVTVTAGSGVTFGSPGGFLDTTVQYSGWVMTKMASNIWWIVGDLEA